MFFAVLPVLSKARSPPGRPWRNIWGRFHYWSAPSDSAPRFTSLGARTGGRSRQSRAIPACFSTSSFSNKARHRFFHAGLWRSVRISRQPTMPCSHDESEHACLSHEQAPPEPLVARSRRAGQQQRTNEGVGFQANSLSEMPKNPAISVSL